MNTPVEKLKNPLTRLWVERIIINHDYEAAKELQRALVDKGQNIGVDGEVGPITIAAIKKVDNADLAEYIWWKRNRTEPSIVKPKWVEIAYKELGTKEIPGKRSSNPRVEQYHDMVGIPWAKDDVPWCGSFMGFIMKKAGFSLSKHPYRALDWLNWGRSSKNPAYGAVAVKKRKGGGHVTLVVGKSRDGRYIYGLGGNQNDAVTIARYPKDIFVDFRIPYGTKANYNIPVMNSKGEVVSEA